MIAVCKFEINVTKLYATDVRVRAVDDNEIVIYGHRERYLFYYLYLYY